MVALLVMYVLDKKRCPVLLNQISMLSKIILDGLQALSIFQWLL